MPARSTPRDMATSRRRRPADRQAGPPPESPLLTVDQICDELHISRSTFYDWRSKGKAPKCIVLPNGSLRVHRDELARWLRGRSDAA
jgi:excisionase family DNA binding protein